MQRRILIIDDHDDLASALDEVFTHQGHSVMAVDSRTDALAVGDLSKFDLIITDLDVKPGDRVGLSNGKADICRIDLPETGEHVKAFKLCTANYRRGPDIDEEQLRELVAITLDYKLRHVDTVESVRNLHEKIDFELPSTLALMHVVLEYLLKRVEKLGVCKPEQTNLFVALDEAFVNAIKHGNKYDVSKLVRVSADLSPEEAKFVIEDEGEGFDVNNILDPLDPENLFKPSGRGVLFIYNIMDEVAYNDRGNRLTMVKKAVSEPRENVT